MMRRLPWIALILALCFPISAVAQVIPYRSSTGSLTTVAVSSTGSHPVLLLTAGLQAIWAQERTDYLADTTCNSYTAGSGQKLACQLYKNALTDSNNAAAGSPPYAYHGLPDYWLAMTPGNSSATYCARVYARLGDVGNLLLWSYGAAGYENVFPMHHMMDFTLMYDGCYNSWTQPQRDAVLAKLNEMAYTITHLQWGSSWQCKDVDEPIGWMFGLAALYEATKSYNQSVVDVWNMANVDGAPGGYTVTTLNCSSGAGKTWRNMVDYYYTTPNVGGVWYEGTEYGFGTENGPYLGLFGNKILATTAAAGLFPEVDAWADDYTRWILHAPTPDERDMAQFDDNDSVRTLLTDRLMWDYGPLAMGMIGMLSDANTDRQLLQRRILNLYAAQPAALSRPRRERQYLLFDPYATAAADLSTMPKYLYSTGAGVTIWREGNSANDCMFWSFFKPMQREIDHSTYYFGDWQLYCNGEWTVTHPLKYGGDNDMLVGAQFSADTSNAIEIEGLGTFPDAAQASGLQYRQITGHTVGTDYVYTSGTQGGSFWGDSSASWDNAGKWDPPPRFVHEHSRTLLALDTATKTLFSVLEINRVNALDPQALEKYDRYVIGAGKTTTGIVRGVQYDQGIEQSPRWTDFLHQRTQPTIAGNVTTWSTPGGQNLRDVWLAPDAVTITKIDETTLPEMDFVNAYEVSEKHWRTKIEPTSDVQWNCLSRIVTARDAGIAVETVTELIPTNNAQGVLVTRPGNDDRVVTWNCAQGADITQLYPTQAQATTILSVARYKAAGSYTFSYPQTTTNAKVLLLDLNPALTWTYTLDGGGSVAITEDSGGLEELSISGVATHTIVVTGTPADGTGPAPAPTPVPDPTPTPVPNPTPVPAPTPTPLEPCTAATQPRITVEYYSPTLKPNAFGRVTLSLTASAGRRIDRVRVKLNDDVVSTIEALDGTLLGGVRFAAPATIGTYRLTVEARDHTGCADTTALRRTVVVQ